MNYSEIPGKALTFIWNLSQNKESSAYTSANQFMNALLSGEYGIGMIEPREMSYHDLISLGFETTFDGTRDTMRVPEWLLGNVVYGPAFSRFGGEVFIDIDQERSTILGMTDFCILPKDLIQVNNLKFCTSNPKKRDEIREMGFEVFEADIKEIQGDADQVIIYKAMAVPELCVVEDSIVTIDDVEIVDWKYSYKEHAVNGTKFVWEVRFAFHSEGTIKVIKTEIGGEFCFDESNLPNSPDFDDYAKHNGVFFRDLKLNINMWWNEYCPRYAAVRKLYEHKFDLIVPKSIVPAWSGPYQED